MDAKTLKALGLIANQLATASTALAQILNADDGDPSPTGTQKAPVKMGWSAKQLKMLEEKAMELVEDAGLDNKTAAAKAVAWMEKKGEKRATPVTSSAHAAEEDPKKRGRPPLNREAAAPDAPKKQVKVKMLTLEEMRDGTAPTLAQFSASLVEAGIERDSEKFAELKAKFLELRKKFKAQLEEENDVADADDLTGDYVIREGDPDAVTFSEEEEAPKKQPRVTVKKEKDAFQFD